MGIIGKVTPKIYEYLRFAGKSSVLEVKPLNFSNIRYKIFAYEPSFFGNSAKSAQVMQL